MLVPKSGSRYIDLDEKTKLEKITFEKKDKVDSFFIKLSRKFG